jgi:hypothetical protein
MHLYTNHGTEPVDMILFFSEFLVNFKSYHSKETGNKQSYNFTKLWQFQY